MDQVVIASAPTTVAFRSPLRSDSDDPYAGESFVVEVGNGELKVAHCVFVFDWAALVGFFTDLAESWKGWSGEKTYLSVEHDLELAATNDARGHCSLSVTIRDGPVASWTVRMDGIKIDVGEDLTNLAAQIADWVEHAHGVERRAHPDRGSSTREVLGVDADQSAAPLGGRL